MVETVVVALVVVLVLLWALPSIVRVLENRRLRHEFAKMRAKPSAARSTVGGTNVVVVTVSEGSRDFAKHTLARTQDYCRRHGFTFFRAVPNVDFEFDAKSLAPQWMKIPALIAAMDKFPSAGVFLWLDDDVYITNETVTPDDITRAAPTKTVFVSRDLSELTAVNPGNMINTGVMIFVRSPSAAALLADVWAHTTTDKSFNVAPYHEQTVMAWKMLRPPHKDVVAVCEKGVLQSYVHVDTPNEFRWAPGDFAVHVCAETPEFREQFFSGLQCGAVCEGVPDRAGLFPMP